MYPHLISKNDNPFIVHLLKIEFLSTFYQKTKDEDGENL